jgi:FHA domain
MIAVCPLGHTSASEDYCDRCGTRIEPAVPGGRAPGPPPPATAIFDAVEEEEHDTAAATQRQPCPACGWPRCGDDRFCEKCGRDFLASAPAAQWEARISADEAYFARHHGDGIAFPESYSERRVALETEQIRIGRARQGAADVNPEIDLAGACEDPGVSRMHAELVRQGDGSYAVRDSGSTNGTTINDDPQPIAVNRLVPLGDGDAIHLGAWTTIVVRRRP